MMMLHLGNTVQIYQKLSAEEGHSKELNSKTDTDLSNDQSV